MIGVFGTVEQLTPIRIWDGVSARAVHGEQATVAVIELDAGILVPEHSHANEQIGALVEGTATVRIGDETRELERGAVWRIPGGVPHEFQIGAERALIFECFSPPRSDWESLPELPQSAPRWP